MKVFIGKYVKWKRLYNYLPECLQPKRTCIVVVDKHDSWDAFSTIAKVAYPVVKQLKETSYSYAIVDLNDLPEHVRKYCIGDEESAWNWVLNEILFSLEFAASDKCSTDYFMSENPINERGWEKLDTVLGNDLWYCSGGSKQLDDRVQRGYELFGKYFSALWD